MQKKLTKELSAYDGNVVSWGVMDGESHLVDAVARGHAVAVQVDNSQK